MDKVGAHAAIDATSLNDDSKNKLHAMVIKGEIKPEELYNGMTGGVWAALLPGMG
jgi:hypothetical protein